MPRVSDAKVQNIAASCAVNDATVDGDVVLDLALDLRDSRAAVSAANAALLALQRRIDRAREALDLGNTDRARRVLEGGE